MSFISFPQPRSPSASSIALVCLIYADFLHLLLFIHLVHLFQLVFTSKYLAAFPNVVRWFTSLINQPEFAKVVGKVEFAKEEQQPPKAAKAEKPKAEKPAAAAATGSAEAKSE